MGRRYTTWEASAARNSFIVRIENSTNLDTTDEHGDLRGRAVAESSYHHFVDYNWDIEKGCPSVVIEPPGDAVRKYPARLEDVKAYVRNLAWWLGPATRE